MRRLPLADTKRRLARLRIMKRPLFASDVRADRQSQRRFGISDVHILEFILGSLQPQP